MSPIDRILQELADQTSGFTVSRGDSWIAITRGDGMQAVFRDAGDGLVEVAYERALHETVRELCAPALALDLLRRVLSRTRLEPVPLVKP